MERAKSLWQSWLNFASGNMETSVPDWQSHLLEAGYGSEVVTKLRSLEPQQLEELVQLGSTSTTAGVLAVQAAWLLRSSGQPGLVNLTASSSHAVGVRALTALLKSDTAQVLELPLSSARQAVVLRALARLGHSALRGLVTPELLAKCRKPTAAQLLMKGASEEQASMVRDQWPGLGMQHGADWRHELFCFLQKRMKTSSQVHRLEQWLGIELIWTLHDSQSTTAVHIFDKNIE